MNKNYYISIVVLIIIVLAIFFYSAKQKSFLSVLNNSTEENSTDETSETKNQELSKYIEVINSCDHAFVGDCVNVRSGPGEEFPVVSRLRNNIVLLIEDTPAIAKDGKTWYKINFTHQLLYPERIGGDWYVAANLVKEFSNSGDHNLTEDTATTTNKRIVVDVSEQKIYAYEGDSLFIEEPISTGLEFTPTPRGTFTIFKKTPSRFMQGPIPGVSDQIYDLPGVPWDLYFTEGGAVIHGAYWHDKFGEPWSHGCVNLSPENAKKLYMWARVGTKVTVQD